MSADDASHDPSRHSDLAVLDANEYKQKRRLERILDSHDRVEEIAADAFDAYVNGEIDEHGKNIALLQAVKQFIREIYQLLQRHAEAIEAADDDEDVERRRYLLNCDLGEVTFDRRRNVSFDGLNEILLAQPTYVETWQEEIESRHGPSRSVEKQAVHSVPETISWHAYLTATEFLAEEHDLELQFEALDDSLGVWGYEETDPDAELEVGEDGQDDEVVL
jgi:hypothetical protein